MRTTLRDMRLPWLHPKIILPMALWEAQSICWAKEWPQCGGVHGCEVIHVSHFLSLVGFNSTFGGWITKSAGHSLAVTVSWTTLNLVEKWIKPSLFSSQSSEGIYIFDPWPFWHLQWLALLACFVPRSFSLPVSTVDGGLSRILHAYGFWWKNVSLGTSL